MGLEFEWDKEKDALILENMEFLLKKQKKCFLILS